MAKRTKAQPEDRVVRKDNGERGTIVFTHEGTTPKGAPPNYSVLPDRGRKRTVIWKGDECDWELPPAIRHCYRCGEDGHIAIGCPRWDCGHQLTTEGHKALEDAGYDPRTMPVRRSGPPEAIEGPTIAIRHDGSPVHLMMRHWVCEIDGVVVDGHDLTDGACEQCGVIVDG